MTNVSVIGGGAFGTALANTAARAGAHVTIWALEQEVVAAINELHENTTYLKGVPLDVGIQATDDVAEACKGAQIVLLVPPAQHLRNVAALVGGAVDHSVPVVICSKGIEQKTGMLMSEVASAVIPRHPVAILSGPTFAAELALGAPSAVTLASSDEATGDFVARCLHSRTFRPYATRDVIGAQIGGAVKNVVAIAAGVAMGLDLGENARAALITRGLAEMTRLGLAKGARQETLMGLSGMGDLLLTCGSAKSRNTSLGMEIATGRTVAEIMAERKSVAEGVFTAAALVDLSARIGVDMPITRAVHALLTLGTSPRELIDELLARPLRAEQR